MTHVASMGTRITACALALAATASVGKLATAMETVAIRKELYEGMTPHQIRQLDGKGGYTMLAAECRVISTSRGGLNPFGVVQMDNGEVALMCGGRLGGKQDRPVIAFSKDGGRSWSDFLVVPNGVGRPVLLAYLGKGNLTFRTQRPAFRFFSSDYGRTWSEPGHEQPAAHGGEVSGEGNPLVDLDADGNATRVAQVNWYCESGSWKPTGFTTGVVRWSTDGCRTWTAEIKPAAWRFKAEHAGSTYVRGTDEGSLVRAANGWIVASLRTNMLPQYFALHNDQFEATAVSISKDDGKTWSRPEPVAEAGRMHSCLVRMPNDDLVMAMIVRHDILDGKLTSNRRGCEAIVSRDHGQSWDLGRKYILDGFEHQDPKTKYPNICGHVCSTLLDDGFVLTGYGNYRAGATLIRWKPVADAPH